MKSNILTAILVMVLLFPGVLSANTVKKELPDAISNPYMLLMITLIFVLLLAILVLNFSIKSVSTIQTNKKENKGQQKSKILFTLTLLFISSYSFAQNTIPENLIAQTETSADWTLFGMTYLTFYGLLSCIFFEVMIIITQLFIIRGFINVSKSTPEFKIKTKSSLENKFWKKMNASIALEDEEEILFEHEYDGIRELDNNLPPWWKYGFYLTIVFAFLYMIHYHVAMSGSLQEEEYLTEIEEGKRQVAEYLKNAADNVDENTVEYLEDFDDLNEGKGIYVANCVACHGVLGEGKVGPNLTDKFWIHGGSIKDIFFSVKYGWPDKGMKSWKDDLTPKQLAKVSSYLKSLKGTNPPNALEPKGEIFND